MVTITLGFDPPMSDSRGVCWILERFDGGVWSNGVELHAYSPGFGGATEPPLTPRPLVGEPSCILVATVGVGPDVILLPPEFVEPGRYRLCPVLSPEVACAELELE